ncbi:MAG TPA: hypothetical protein VFC65_08785 [Prolixibacteraceae bacterium]|nr:hypothetical protein [Prolixibacteraceae bacterium]
MTAPLLQDNRIPFLTALISRSAYFIREVYRLRKGGKLFRFEREEVQWKANIDRLLELLDIEQLDQKIMVAELHRNLWEFERCLELINSIEDAELEWLKAGFNRECNKKNRNVFLLSTTQ